MRFFLFGHCCPWLPDSIVDHCFQLVLTESARMAKQCLLVISLPASDTTGSPHAVADDVEVGGERGRAALDRLRNAVGRVEASWRPASAEEGFEIVRRRLFEPLVEKDQFVARDTVAIAFNEMYRANRQEFPPECGDSDYEKRLKAAYPIHPEIFDRLYTDWSTLVPANSRRVAPDGSCDSQLVGEGRSQSEPLGCIVSVPADVVFRGRCI